MSDARRLAEAHYREMDEKDFSAAGDIFSPDVETVEPGTGSFVGMEACVAHSQAFTTAFPDARMEVVSVIEGGDRVVLESVFVGTNTGPMHTPQGELPPTGRAVRLDPCDIYEAEAGRIRRHRIYYDQMGFLAQLGLTPGA